MLRFLSENLATILVGLIVLLVFCAVVIKLIRDRRRGASCCGGCSGCAGAGECSRRR